MHGLLMGALSTLTSSEAREAMPVPGLHDQSRGPSRDHQHLTQAHALY